MGKRKYDLIIICEDNRKVIYNNISEEQSNFLISAITDLSENVTFAMILERVK